MTTAPLRPLTTGELLDRTFSLYKDNFALFVGIVALPRLISLAVQLSSISLRSQTGLSAAFGAALWGLVFALVSLMVAAASQAATVVAVSQLHLGRPTSVSDAYSRVKGRIVRVALLTIVVGLGVGLGFVLLVIPGIILALMWSLAVPVAILEDRGINDSVSRSSELTKGSRWRIFVIWVMFIVLSIVVAFLIEWPIGLVAGMLGAKAVNSAGIQVASAIASFISQCLVGPLATIGFSLLYYDQRVRKEAFDLHHMMETLDGTQPGLAHAT
ncbi:MAG: hypothetical protein DMG81_03095 [Acidobacteria bacterium]|nr:MAG: hypothetical protein DMG81_03095 [Acidobacteriota bacterium]